MENLYKQIEKLNCMLHDNGSVYSVYPYNKYTIQEVVCEMVTKINEVVDIVEEYTTLIKTFIGWVENEGLNIEVKKIIDEMLLDGRLAEIINTTIFEGLNTDIKNIKDYNLYVSVKEYGAKGDGITNDTVAIVNCMKYCIENNKTMYLPRGNYIINYDGLNPLVSDNQKLLVRGESYLNTSINYVQELIPEKKSIFNCINVKNIHIEDISTSTANPIDFVTPGAFNNAETYAKELRGKTIYLKNVIYNGTGGHTSYNELINNPAPKNYDRYSDGNYAKYPLQIQNFSGFNAINIENMPTNADGSIGIPEDNNAIGILDRCTNTGGVIAIDMYGERDMFRLMSSAPLSSSDRPRTVFETNFDGHTSIGCSVQGSDSVAPGVATLKLRDEIPSIKFYDNKGNICSIQMVDGWFGVALNGEYIFSTNGNELQEIKSGTTAQRPTGVKVGYRYFDTTLGLPIYWQGTVWVKADGYQA